MDQLLKIDIFGQTFRFRTETAKAQAEAVAAALMEEVERIAADQTGQVLEMNKLTILILAALNLANENYELKAQWADRQQQAVHRTTRLIRMLDNALVQRAGICAACSDAGPVKYASP